MSILQQFVISINEIKVFLNFRLLYFSHGRERFTTIMNKRRSFPAEEKYQNVKVTKYQKSKNLTCGNGKQTCCHHSTCTRAKHSSHREPTGHHTGTGRTRPGRHRDQ